MLKMMDALDDNEDLQKVFANFDISESEMMRISAVIPANGATSILHVI